MLGLDVKEASLYEKLENKLVRCHLCPRQCYIRDRSRGFCKVRENREGTLYALTFNKITAMNVDPIEKKPFLNFWPGSEAFSISSASCSFACPWCQNWNISQADPDTVLAEEVESTKVVELAKKYGCRSIAYTYNEPIIWFEYVIETAKLAKKEGIFNLLVTNGYATVEAIKDFTPYFEGANVDVKGFTPDFYLKYCKGKLEDVLTATESMVEKGWHVELTYLIIPEINDNFDAIKKMARWVLERLGPDTPVHFSRFYPMYRMSHLRSTPLSYIVRARDIAIREGLHYVYAGNVPGYEGENTFCPKCNTLLIRRIGLDILEWKITGTMNCPACGEKIAIKGKYERKRAFSG